MKDKEFCQERIKYYQNELKKLDDPEYVKKYIADLKEHYKRKIRLFELEKATTIAFDRKFGRRRNAK